MHSIIYKWQLSWQCDNLIFISHASKSTVSFSVTSVTSHMKSHMSQDSGIHQSSSPLAVSDIPLQSFSYFRKVSRSPIIRSVRLLAAHARVAIATCTLPAEHTVWSALSSIPTQICSERNYVTSKTETENRFWPFPNPKNRFCRRNPVLETLPVTVNGNHTLFMIHSEWRP